MAGNRVRQFRCSRCGKAFPGYNCVSLGTPEKGYREFCFGCSNTEYAESLGLTEFEHVDFEPIEVADSRGRKHKFHFRTRLFGDGVALDALEMRKGEPAGYEFQVADVGRVAVQARDPEPERRSVAGRAALPTGRR
jgi:hypothetical protein